MYVPTTIPESALLAHDAFVRRLARRVARDEHQVDDIVQETWLAALRQGHRVRGPLRPWLARVVGNVAADQHRAQSRREHREAWAAREESQVSTLDDAEQSSARSKLVRVVLEMPEPYRSTIVLRYYEELGVSQIAQRVEAPVETVRTRLKRGLKILRRRVELERGGGRSPWTLPALLIGRASDAAGEIVRRARESVRSVRAAPSAAQIVVAAFVPAVALAVIALISTSAFEVSSVRGAPVAARAPDSARLRDAADLADRSPVLTGELVALDEVVDALAPRSVSGRVLDDHGVGQAGVRVAWWPARPTGAEAPSGSTTSDAFGRYRLDGIAPAFSIDASGAGFVAAATLEARQVPSGELGGLDLDLVRPQRITGRVTNASSEPVAGAQIQLLLARTDLPQRTASVRGLFYVSKSGASVATDANGAFALEDLAPGKYTLSATHPDYPRLGKRVVAGALDLELRMPKPSPCVLEVVDSAGRPLEGARVTLCGAPHELTFAETRADGRTPLARFETGATFFARIEHPRHAPALAGPLVVDGAQLVIRAVAGDARKVRGTLVDGDGTPIADAAVTVRSGLSIRQLDASGFRALRELGAFGSASTAGDGSFELDNLPRQALVLDVARAGALAIEQSFELAPDDERADLAIGRGARDVAALEITVRDAATGLPLESFACAACPQTASLLAGPRRSRFERARGGRATWAVLRPGDWWLCVKAPGFAAALVPIERLEAGVREVAVELFAPRVLALEIVDRAGMPVSNAPLELTDAQGHPLLAACQPRQNANLVRTGPHGEATLFELPASTVRVAVTVPERSMRFDPFEFDLRTEPGGVQRVVLEAFDREAPMRELAIELPRAWIGETVHVAVLDARPGVRIALDGVLGPDGLQPTRTDGMAVYQQIDETGLAKTMWLQGTIAPRAGRLVAGGDRIEIPIAVWTSARALEVRHGASGVRTLELDASDRAVAISSD